MRIAGLFAGIAGLERGLEKFGHETSLFCEVDPGAQAILRDHYPRIEICSDVRDLSQLPQKTELVTAGFPCQDLSQAGRTKGIGGQKSGVVDHLFRLLASHDVPHVLIENVPFMLQLERGAAMRHLVGQLEGLGYHWAYRIVDARAFGLPQRRERVFLLASRLHDPASALLSESEEPVVPKYRPDRACGFYWTEGSRGLGWAVDAIPTLKGGSTIGIPSPPAIWMPDGRIVRPDIVDAERLQGFPANWTLPAATVVRAGFRWKYVGNAVSVRVAEWLGEKLSTWQTLPTINPPTTPFDQRRSWPRAATGSPGTQPSAVEVSSWPRRIEAAPLAEFLSKEPPDLSFRAVTGFINRLTASSLRYREEFLAALLNHQTRMRPISETPLFETVAP